MSWTYLRMWCTGEAFPQLKAHIIQPAVISIMVSETNKLNSYFLYWSRRTTPTFAQSNINPANRAKNQICEQDYATNISIVGYSNIYQTNMACSYHQAFRRQVGVIMQQSGLESWEFDLFSVTHAGIDLRMETWTEAMLNPVK